MNIITRTHHIIVDGYPLWFVVLFICAAISLALAACNMGIRDGVHVEPMPTSIIVVPSPEAGEYR